MTSRRLAKVSLALAILAMVVGGIGLFVTPFLSAFVLDKYDAYGEVPIPGSASVHLPAGKINVSSFHTEVISGPNGGGLPVPQLGMDIDPPQGVPDPVVTESYGGTTTINNDSHRRVWVVQVPADGTYAIKTEGQVNGFISPSLAFGQESSHGWSVSALALPSPAPPDQAIRLAQLKTLASLRDSGALTEAEFEAEKRRILDGR